MPIVDVDRIHNGPQTEVVGAADGEAGSRAAGRLACPVGLIATDPYSTFMLLRACTRIVMLDPRNCRLRPGGYPGPGIRAGRRPTVGDNDNDGCRHRHRARGEGDRP